MVEPVPRATQTPQTTAMLVAVVVGRALYARALRPVTLVSASAAVLSSPKSRSTAQTIPTQPSKSPQAHRWTSPLPIAYHALVAGLVLSSWWLVMPPSGMVESRSVVLTAAHPTNVPPKPKARVLTRSPRQDPLVSTRFERNKSCSTHVRMQRRDLMPWITATHYPSSPESK